MRAQIAVQIVADGLPDREFALDGSYKAVKVLEQVAQLEYILDHIDVDISAGGMAGQPNFRYDGRLWMEGNELWTCSAKSLAKLVNKLYRKTYELLREGRIP